jgi:hypothetical protein
VILAAAGLWIVRVDFEKAGEKKVVDVSWSVRELPLLPRDEISAPPAIKFNAANPPLSSRCARISSRCTEFVRRAEFAVTHRSTLLH